LRKEFLWRGSAMADGDVLASVAAQNKELQEKVEALERDLAKARAATQQQQQQPQHSQGWTAASKPQTGDRGEPWMRSPNGERRGTTVSAGKNPRSRPTHSSSTGGIGDGSDDSLLLARLARSGGAAERKGPVGARSATMRPGLGAGPVRVDDLTGIDEDLGAAVIECAQAGNVAKLQKLLSIGVEVTSRDESGYTAMHWAAMQGHSPCMKFLLLAGADCNAVDQGGWTPLHYAAYKGHRSCVLVLLIQPKIDLEAKNSQKKTALQLASQSGKNSKAIVTLIKDSMKPSVRSFVEIASKFYRDPNGGLSNSGPTLPQDITDARDDLAEQNQQLLQAKGRLSEAEAELERKSGTISSQQKAAAELSAELAKREAVVEKLESEMLEQVQTLGEKDIGSEAFVIQDPAAELTFVEELGKGSFGVVWKAKYRGDIVAAKKLDVAATSSALGGADAEVLKQFQAEASLLAKLRHPNIVMLMAVACRLPELILVVELMSGTLQSLLLSKDKLSWPERINLAIGSARGLNYLHSCGLVHRDVKSENLLHDEFHRVKVSDFGTVVTTESLGQELVGTTSYMPPERLVGEGSDPSTDVFAFGVVLWELMNRKVPWEGSSNLQIVARVGHANERLPLPDRTPSGCPPSFVPLVQYCWDSVSSRRPQFPAVLETLNSMV
jgi:multidrug efflux pump subunit AcrA (membrane-fusion protein)